MKTIIIDGDMVAYRAAFSSEYETKWDDDHWTLLCSEKEMKREVETFFENLSNKLDSDDLFPVFSPLQTTDTSCFLITKPLGKTNGSRWV